MDTVPTALRSIATQFEQLIGNARRSPSVTGGGNSRIPIWEQLSNLSSVSGSEALRSVANSLGKGLLGELSDGANDNTVGGRLRSLLPVAGTAGAALDGVMQGPLGLLSRSLVSLFRRDPEPMSYSVHEQPEALSMDFDLGSMALRDRQEGEGTGFSAGSPNEWDSRGHTQQTPVVIQVNTMDARSFADHRDEIASAVREALTRNHALRDEIWED